MSRENIPVVLNAFGCTKVINAYLDKGFTIMNRIEMAVLEHDIDINNKPRFVSFEHYGEFDEEGRALYFFKDIK